MTGLLLLAVEAIKDLLTRIQGDRITFAWIREEYKHRGVTQHHFRELANRGALRKEDNSRGGHRAYYRVMPHPVWS